MARVDTTSSWIIINSKKIPRNRSRDKLTPLLPEVSLVYVPESFDINSNWQNRSYDIVQGCHLRWRFPFWPPLFTRGIKQGIFQGKGIFGHLPCILCDTSYDCLQYHSRNDYYQWIPQYISSKEKMGPSLIYTPYKVIIKG